MAKWPRRLARTYLSLIDMINKPIKAEPGAEIQPAFQAAKATAMALQPRPGANALLSQTPYGYVISGKPQSGRFAHPFKSSLQGGKVGFVRVAKGLVDIFEPVIRVDGKKVPLSGDATHLTPVLKLTPLDGEARSDGSVETWVCVEVTPDEDGAVSKESLIEVVHRDSPKSNDPDVGRHPLALILWAKKEPRKLFQITYFNLRYYRTNPPEGAGIPHHFFL